MKEQKASCLFNIVISMGFASEFKVIEKFGDVTLEFFFEDMRAYKYFPRGMDLLKFSISMFCFLKHSCFID